MKAAKKSFIKFFDKIIVLLLGISGAFSSCTHIQGDDPVVEYGMPHADFEIKGSVTNAKTSEPIPNIQVIREIYKEFGDTAYTDSNGKYVFNFQDYPANHYRLKVNDIDGEENGGAFTSKIVDVEIAKEDKVQPGKGWYNGKFLKIQDIPLDTIGEGYGPMYGVFPTSFKP